MHEGVASADFLKEAEFVGGVVEEAGIVGGA